MSKSFHTELARALLAWHQAATDFNAFKKENGNQHPEFDNYRQIYRESLISLICVMNVYDLPESIPLDDFGTLAESIKDAEEKRPVSDAKAEKVKQAAKVVINFITKNKQQLIEDAGWQ